MKKSQMKQTETVTILIVFIILVFFSFIVYSQQKSKSIDREVDERNMMRSIEVATKAYMLPEIQCSESQCIGCTGAMDIIKLDAVSNTTTNQGVIFSSVDYFKEFGYATITVQIIYPNQSDLPDNINHNWTIYNRTAPGFMSQVIPTYIPVNIFNPYENLPEGICYFGVMEVATYS